MNQVYLITNLHTGFITKLLFVIVILKFTWRNNQNSLNSWLNIIIIYTYIYLIYITMLAYQSTLEILNPPDGASIASWASSATWGLSWESKAMRRMALILWADNGGSAVNSCFKGEGGTEPSPGVWSTDANRLRPARDKLMADRRFWGLSKGVTLAEGGSEDWFLAQLLEESNWKNRQQQKESNTLLCIKY